MKVAKVKAIIAEGVNELFADLTNKERKIICSKVFEWMGTVEEIESREDVVNTICLDAFCNWANYKPLMADIAENNNWHSW